jgi:transcriptional regulator of arginine metabolism
MPPDSELREHRQEKIIEILKAGAQVASQGEMVELLAQRGIAATQSSVSRDLRDLGVFRMGRYYALPSSPESADGEAARIDLEERASRFLVEVRTAGPHITVVLTDTGAAQTVALAIDNVGWSEVVGTMAGDDTIFIATAGAAEQRRVVERLNQLLPER